LETKKKIMSCAFELFAKKGVRLSLSEIATEVGIKKASIYAHYDNKDLLIHKVIEEEIEKYFFEINQENDDLEKIFFKVLEYYGNSQTKLLFWKRLLLFPPKALSPDLIYKINYMTEKRYEVVKIVIQKNIQNNTICKDPEEVSLMFFSLLHGLLSSVLIYHPQDIRNHYKNIWINFWNSITIRKV